MATKKSTTGQGAGIPAPEMSGERAGQSLSELRRETALDWAIRDFRAWAKKGDATAAAELHRILARAIRDGVLTPLAKETLAKMHEEIAEGRDAAAATLTKKVSNRAPNGLRDRMIVNQVVCMTALYQHWHSSGEIEKVPTRQEIFSETADDFGIKTKTVENIYFRRNAPEK